METGILYEIQEMPTDDARALSEEKRGPGSRPRTRTDPVVDDNKDPAATDGKNGPSGQ